MSEARDHKPFLAQSISVGQLREICVSIDSVGQRDHVETMVSIWYSCYEIDLAVHADFES